MLVGDIVIKKGNNKVETKGGIGNENRGEQGVCMPARTAFQAIHADDMAFCFSIRITNEAAGIRAGACISAGGRTVGICARTLIHQGIFTV